MQENKTQEMLHGNVRHCQVYVGNFRLVLYEQVFFFSFFQKPAVEQSSWLGELTLQIRMW